MGFDHERLDVYRTALDFLEFTDSLIASLPRGPANDEAFTAAHPAGRSWSGTSYSRPS